MARAAMFGVLTHVFQLVGLGLILFGLYRRDPGTQRVVGRLRGRLRRWVRRLLRRRPREVALEATLTGTSQSSGMARLTVRPGPLREDATHEERLARLERAVDLAFEELDEQAGIRAEEVSKLRAALAAVERAYQADAREFRHLLDEATAPERLECWGVALVAVGVAFGIVDATFAGA